MSEIFKPNFLLHTFWIQQVLLFFTTFTEVEVNMMKNDEAIIFFQ